MDSLFAGEAPAREVIAQDRHRFEAAEVQSVHVEAQATNGDALARIFESRCYALESRCSNPSRAR